MLLYKLNLCRFENQAFGVQPIKTYKYHVPPNDLKYDHWRTPLDQNIEWKSQDFYNAVHKIEPYKYARHTHVEKSKKQESKEDTSLKSSPIISSMQINIVSNKRAKKDIEKYIDPSLSNTDLEENYKVIMIYMKYYFI